jgi:hypothetical protein
MPARFLLLLLLGLAGQLPARAAEFRACADAAEMPPFLYAAAAPATAQGIAVDLLRRALAEMGGSLTVDLLPGARCLQQARDGRYAFVLNVGPAEAQANALLLSRPLFRLHGVYVYSTRARPKGLNLERGAETRALNLCGLGGLQFDGFGIPAERFDLGTTRSFEQLVNKLHSGHCDAAVGSREELAGHYLNSRRLGSEIASGALRIQPLPGAPEASLHVAVPGGHEGAAALLQGVNSQLERLERQGLPARLVVEHLDARSAGKP